ncbi:IS3 family transposase, partial [Paenibacillus larvae]
ESYKQAYEIVNGFIHNYNHNRIHGSIYDMSPYEYMDAVRKKAVEPKTIKV